MADMSNTSNTKVSFRGKRVKAFLSGMHDVGVFWNYVSCGKKVKVVKDSLEDGLEDSLKDSSRNRLEEERRCLCKKQVTLLMISISAH